MAKMIMIVAIAAMTPLFREGDPPADEVTVHIPPGKCPVVDGRSYGPGSYNVPRGVGQQLADRDFVVEGLTKQPVSVNTNEIEREQEVDPTLQVAPVTPATGEEVVDPAMKNVGVSTTSAGLTGPIPQEIAGYQALKNADLTDWADLDGVDLTTIPGLSVEDVATIDAVIKNGGVIPSGAPADDDVPVTNTALDSYLATADLPEEFPRRVELREAGIVTFADLRRKLDTLAEHVSTEVVADVYRGVGRTSGEQPAIDQDANQADKTEPSGATVDKTVELFKTELTGPLPDDMPGENALKAAGYETWESLNGVDLIAVDGIGDVKFGQIKEWAANGGQRPTEE